MKRRIPIVKVARGERQNLVFGWASVPYPVANAEQVGSSCFAT